MFVVYLRVVEGKLHLLDIILRFGMSTTLYGNEDQELIICLKVFIIDFKLLSGSATRAYGYFSQNYKKNKHPRKRCFVSLIWVKRLKKVEQQHKRN